MLNFYELEWRFFSISPSLIEDMKECAQNPKWHSEGNVYNHTKLVVEEMEKSIKDSDFSEKDQLLLMICAFLHDIGKPIAGRINGKKKPTDEWNSVKGHAEVGAPIAYDLCKKSGYPEDFSLEVAWLVKYHMIAHDLKQEDLFLVENPLFKKLVFLARADEKGCKSSCDDERLGVDGSLKKLGVEYDY